jgi:hypothetical protein
MDDFSIKVSNMTDFTYLNEALTKHYTVTRDYKGSIFCGIHLNWDYIQCHVDCSMPGYITMALTKYQHK